MLVFGEAGVMACVGTQQRRPGCHHQPSRVPSRTASAKAFPNPIVRRQVLAQCSLGPAIETVLKAERGSSINFLISHREGEAIDLEATPDQVFWLTPEDDLLVHANHFVSTPARVARARPRTPDERRLPLSGQPRAPLPDAGIAAESRSPRSRPRSRIASARRARCAAPRSPAKSSATVATIIMDTTAQIMWVAPRPYGPHKFTEYRLP